MSEISLIGKKIGMTREFYKTGQSVPVTVVKMEKARIIQVIEQEKRGYKAVQLGFGKIKNSKLSKAMKGFYTKKNTEPKKKLQEFRVEKTENYKEGNEFGLEIFKDIKFVDVKSKTIGKGFAGVMKRYNFSGLRATHGVSVSHRSHGSTGQRQDPGKVFKGKKMAGHMGDAMVTKKNLQIVKVDVDKKLILVKGAVPGFNGRLVEVTQSAKIQKVKVKPKPVSAKEKSPKEKVEGKASKEKSPKEKAPKEKVEEKASKEKAPKEKSPKEKVTKEKVEGKASKGKASKEKGGK